MNTRNRFGALLLALIIGALAFAAPTFAQEATPEPTLEIVPTVTTVGATIPLPDGGTIVSNSVINLIGLIVILFAATAAGLGILLFNSAPRWLKSLIENNLDWIAARAEDGLNTVTSLFEATPDPDDEKRWAQVRAEIETNIVQKILDGIREMSQTPAVAGKVAETRGLDASGATADARAAVELTRG